MTQEERDSIVAALLVLLKDVSPKEIGEIMYYLMSNRGGFDASHFMAGYKSEQARILKYSTKRYVAMT